MREGNQISLNDLRKFFNNVNTIGSRLSIFNNLTLKKIFTINNRNYKEWK